MRHAGRKILYLKAIVLFKLQIKLSKQVGLVVDKYLALQGPV